VPAGRGLPCLSVTGDPYGGVPSGAEPTVPAHGGVPDPARGLVVGVDAGGTRTRALVAARDGTPYGRGEAGGANPRSGGGDAAAPLTVALRAALVDVDPAHVVGGVVALAGAGAAGHAAATAAAGMAWDAVGLPGVPRVLPDVLAAYAAGTAKPCGTVLVAGTGAIAAAVADDAVVRRADGHGWLLGDAGSAVWLGRAAVRAALAGLDGRGPATALTRLVTSHLGVPAEGTPDGVAQAVIAAVDHTRPVSWGVLAPLVTEAAQEGDAVAHALARRAADALLDTLAAVHRGGPVVLAGGTLTADGPVAALVRAGAEQRAGVRPRPAGDGAGGAAWLACRAVGPARVPTAGRAETAAPGREGSPAAVHARLTAPAPAPAGVVDDLACPQRRRSSSP
jgi:glucosamine kinase